MSEAQSRVPVLDDLREELSAKEVLITAQRERITSLEGRNEALQSALINHAHEIELLKRRLFGARSERTGTSENQLPLAGLLVDAAELQKELDEANAARGNASGDTTDDEPKNKDKAKPKGRRDLAQSSLPQVVVTIEDPELAAKGKLLDYDISHQLGYRRGGFFVIVKRTAKYELPTAESTTVLSAPSPKAVLSRGMLHTSLIAWIIVQKFGLGVPHYRLEQQLEAEGTPLSRSVMCRNAEEVGNALGATVVHAMIEHARTTCGVLSTDATGASIQPGPREGGPKRECDKGHFFTIVADRDHVLFEFTSEHTSAVVAKLFQGFKGYLQTDASSVYDVLDHGPLPLDDDPGVTLVGCWAHCRRYFFEAAVCKYEVGVEGLRRIRDIYHVDQTFKDRPPGVRKKLREQLLRPLIDRFFAWVAETRRTAIGRTLATKALGYATNQETELRRVLLDGRLPLDNTRSERSLRTIVVGRKNWLFYGSEVHAQGAAALFSLLASCRLHGIEPTRYLDELLHVLPYWPRERFLELSPLRWTATRARLDLAELEAPIGAITVPPAE